MTAAAGLAQALLRQVTSGLAAADARLVETHISWVLLAGQFAYKIKKPVRLPFLDFSSLQLRKAACEEELRLNRMLAPQIYIGVVPITGSPEQPHLGGDGTPIEYAVKMRRFSESRQLDCLLDAGALPAADLERFGGQLARLHEAAAIASVASAWGDPAQVQAPFRETLRDLGADAPADCRADLEGLDTWLHQAGATLHSTLAGRNNEGRIRECHGDLHLANLVMLDEGIVPFDRIEFSEALRWIDVISDVAFLVMDLDRRGHSDLAHAFLVAYLEASGDYQGLRLLPYYEVYRALVRAKVAAIRWRSGGAAADSPDARECVGHVRWAASRIRGRRPGLVLMHGLSGSGKTRLSGELLQLLPAVRVRSDLERKRMHGLRPLQRGKAEPGAGLYSASASQRVYSTLAEIVQAAIAAGETIIVDAAFLRAGERKRFFELAAHLGAHCALVECVAPVAELERRVLQRAAQGRDASDAGLAVLQAQLDWLEPLDEAERARAVTVDTVRQSAAASIAAALRQLLTG